MVKYSIPINDTNILPVGETILHLISSIRTIDGQIKEIKRSIKSGYVTPEGKIALKTRMIKLLETRLSLVFSLMDEKLSFNRYLDDETKLCYENLKREIQEV